MNNTKDGDVIVIGSGFGGSIAASRLARAGSKVLLFERGPWRDTAPVRAMGIAGRAPLPYGARAYSHLLRGASWNGRHLGLNRAGLLELAMHPGLNIVTSSSVGGGSHVWAGMLERPHAPDYWQGHHPLLAPGQVEQYYDRIIADLGAERATRSDAIPNSIWSHLPGAGRCQPAATQPCTALQLEEHVQRGAGPPGTLASVARAACRFDGDGFLGSRHGAKATLDAIYLAPALGCGLTVRELCEANRITRAADGYTVHYTDLRTGRAGTARATTIVLAAGTMNTLQLLFASAGALGAMPALGRNFGANGDLFGAWLREAAATPLYRAPPMLGRLLVDGASAPWLGLAGMPGIDTVPMPAFLKRMLARTVPVLGMGIDSGHGAVSWHNGRLRVHYDAAHEAVYRKIRAGFEVLREERGGKLWLAGKALTMHPWGGASLGADAAHGVIGRHGEIHGNPGLYIADGAALPAAPGVPPSLTIAAWAHHVAESLAHRIA
ncbi:MAG: GMC family oxidoreductase [Pseudomonadota bacterium]